VFQEPIDYSTVQTGVASTMRIYAVDDCGNPLTQANGDAIQVTFNNNDVPLNLQDIGAGVWEGTWTPENREQITLQANPFSANASLNSFDAEITTAVQSPASSAAPQISGW